MKSEISEKIKEDTTPLQELLFWIESFENMPIKPTYINMKEKIWQLTPKETANKKELDELKVKYECLLMRPSNSEIELWEKEEHLRTLKNSFIELSKRVVYTEEEKEKYYEVECDCGFKGLSIFLLGGGQIADTGDYGDCYCPCCNSIIN